MKWLRRPLCWVTGHDLARGEPGSASSRSRCRSCGKLLPGGRYSPATELRYPPPPPHDRFHSGPRKPMV